MHDMPLHVMPLQESFEQGTCTSSFGAQHLALPSCPTTARVLEKHSALPHVPGFTIRRLITRHNTVLSRLLPRHGPMRLAAETHCSRTSRKMRPTSSSSSSALNRASWLCLPCIRF